MPATVKRYEKSIGQPALCEQLRIRDLLDNVAVQINGALVAGYEVSGIHSYYASDDDRNRSKTTLEALVRSLPERSIRMQVRFEISEGTGDLIAQYNRQQRNSSEVLHALDQRHLEAWRAKEQEGFFLKHFLHLYFIWDPRIHHQSPDFEWKQRMRSSNTLSLSVNKCIERSRREHEDLVMEFDSLLSGVEATLQSTGMSVGRMTHNDIFLEVKRALNPLGNDVVPYRPTEQTPWYVSARSQMANVNIENELDDYLKVGGLLYSWISLKDLPDATFPGVLRELVVMDFPLVVNAEVDPPGPSKSSEAVQEPPPKDARRTKRQAWRLSHQCGRSGRRTSTHPRPPRFDFKLPQVLPDEFGGCHADIEAGPQPSRTRTGRADPR